MDFESGREICSSCKRTKRDTSLKCCAQCKIYYYCSRTCQENDWIKGHKNLCPLITKALNAKNKENPLRLGTSLLWIKNLNMKRIEKKDMSSEPCSCMSSSVLLLLQKLPEEGCICCNELGAVFYDGYTFLCTNQTFSKEKEHKLSLRVCSKKCLFKMRKVMSIINEDSKNQIQLCQVCAVPARFRCINCKLVWYCGSTCQQKHWKQHKEKCEKGEEREDLANMFE